MTESVDVRRLLSVLAVHPVLPPLEALSADVEALRTVLADLACGELSTEAETLRAVSSDLLIPVDELVRRAQFVLACLVLPQTGTHYEVLGVAPGATTREIRRRWAALIQRYHPDRFGGGTGWLDSQARRLIEAYQTLKDPARRQAYDAQLESGGLPEPSPSSGLPVGGALPRFGPSRWRWAPAGILAAGLAACLWALMQPTPGPLPKATLPAAPKLLEARGPTSPPAATELVARERGISAILHGAEVTTPPIESTELPFLRDRFRTATAPAAAPTSARVENRAPLRSEAAVASVPAPVSSAVESTPATPTATLGSAPPLPVAGPAPAAPLVLGPGLAPPGRSSRPTSTMDAGAISSAAATGRPVSGVSAVESERDGPPSAARPPVSRSEVLGIVERFRTAYERKDLETLMGLCSADVRDRQVIGHPEVRQLYARNFAALDGIRYQITSLEVASAGGDQFVATGRFHIRATRAGSPRRAVNSSGSMRWELRRESGDLRITAMDYEVARQ